MYPPPPEDGLSVEIVRVGKMSLYAPWSVIAWSLHSAEHPAVRQSLAGLTLYALAVLGATALLARHGAPRIRPFGLDGWGTQREMKRAGLLNEIGTVVGIFRERLLTYDGPEHQLVSGASRAGKGVGHVVPTLLC